MGAASPLRILFTIPNFITAGSGDAMLNIIKRLDRRRFAPAVCVLKKGGALDAAVEGMGIPFLEAPMLVEPRPLWSLRARVRRAAVVFRPYGFHLWHSFHYSDDYTEPLVARAAGARAWVYTKKNMGWNHRSWYLRSVLASRIAAQNSDMVRHFFRGPLLRGKARHLPPGVDTERFRPGVPGQTNVRTQLGFPPGAILAGCVAHLVPVKGHPTLLEAIAQVPGLFLVIAGAARDERYTKTLVQTVAEAGLGERVRFLGNVTDVPGLLGELDIAVLPTWDRWRMEGCPIALLEAMACGVACVATEIPGSKDVIEPEESGLLVPPRDAQALSRALARLTAEPELRRRLGDGGRARVLAGYTIEREVEALESLYRSALRLDEAAAGDIV
jgi:glycosyltransferase involved in cell wall biosynthesis